MLTFSRLYLVISCLAVFGHNIFCDSIDVKTSSGLVRGLTVNILNKNVNQFLGIPYAVPPVGSLRFAKPKPIEKPIEVSIE